MATKRKNPRARAKTNGSRGNASRTNGKARASTARRAKAKPVPNALTLLRQDHQEVSAMFARFEKRKDKMTPAQKQALAEEICTALTVHAQIEEEIFYPTVRPEIDEDDLMDEAEVEHGSLKSLIAKVQAEGPSGDYFDAHLIVMGEYVKHHVKEEQGEMFKKVRESDIDLKELGARMLARKQELMAMGGGRSGKGRAAPPLGKRLGNLVRNSLGVA